MRGARSIERAATMVKRAATHTRLVTEELPAEGFDAALRAREKALVLFYGEWCAHSRVFLPAFEAAEGESSVPFLRAPLAPSADPRWERHRLHRVPTLAYFEHGEELERMEAIPRHGLSRRDLEDMMELVEALQEEPQLPKRMHGPRRWR